MLRESIGDSSLWMDVEGASMGSAIPSGSRVRLTLAPAPRFGEVWAYCAADGSIVVHRCLGRLGEGFRFRGDAAGADPPVVPVRLIGRVEAIESRGAVRVVRPWSRWIGGCRLAARTLAGRLYAQAPSPLRSALRRVAGRDRR
jgi:hypothetical protein